LAKTQEGKARLGQDRNRHGERRLHDCRRKHIRQHLSGQDGEMAEALGTGRDVILGADDPCFGTRNTNENSSRLSSQHPVLGQSGRGTALIEVLPDRKN
jgi:hypothetical protein